MDPLREAARQWPERPALTDGRRRRTYGDLDREVDVRARWLAGAGVEPESVVALVDGPTADAVSWIHAVRRAGGVLSPLHPGWTRTELGAALKALSPRLVLPAAGQDAPAGQDARGEPAPSAEAPLPTRLPDVAAILWTSGTGGRRRGVEITMDALAHSAAATARRLDLGPEDTWYASLQPAHVGGLALVVRAALLGSGLAAPGGFGVDDLERRVAAGEVSHASLVPVMLRAWMDARPDPTPPPTLRAVLIGGAHAPPDLVRRALAGGIPVALTYGMTEATSQVATATPDEVAQDVGTVGRPLDGVEVRVDPDGEILVRGPTLARGYRGGEPELTDAGGWYHTGDLGELDGRGRLRILGRRARRIITGGLTLDPAEVEQAVRTLPGVLDCVVVGLPDPRWGERVAAAVVPEPGVPLSVEDLELAQAPLLSAGRRVRGWRLLEGLPLNANGKVDLEAVRRAFADPPPPGAE